uniref:Uncharacterized protein n=1 Tax=Globodera rostochiensis TaxID=31243 RepID=A0A914GVK2_GLORO
MANKREAAPGDTAFGNGNERAKSLPKGTENEEIDEIKQKLINASAIKKYRRNVKREVAARQSAYSTGGISAEKVRTFTDARAN